MNPETTHFEPVTEETPDDWKRVSIGEIVFFNGIKFKVKAIKKKDVVLRRVVAKRKEG